MNILCLSRYAHKGASSRLRFFQYAPYLQKNGIYLDKFPSFDDSYLINLYAGKRSWPRIAYRYLKRLSKFIKIKKYDLIWIEKEIFPYLPAWIELPLFSKRTPIVLDYDDATFHQYDMHGSQWVRYVLGNKIDQIMHRADLVIAGNPYIAERAKAAGASRVEIIPTVVDTSRYQMISGPVNDQITIGWMGSPSTAPFLRMLEPIFVRFVKSHYSQMSEIMYKSF